MKFIQWLLVCALGAGLCVAALFVQTSPMKINTAGDLRTRIASDASAVWSRIELHAEYQKPPILKDFNSDSLPKWWDSYSPRKLWAGVTYTIAPSVVGKTIDDLRPGDPLVAATGPIVQKAFGKASYIKRWHPIKGAG